MMMGFKAIGALCSLMAVLMSCTDSQTDITGLECEGLTSPLGIDTTVPHFSWQHRLRRNGQRQTAYEIEVASDSLLLVNGKADLWVSGLVESDAQVMVPYEGKSLDERQLCYWRVRTQDERGKMSGWSDISRFAVGIIHGMKGEYIGLDDSCGDPSMPILRNKFVAEPQSGKPVFVHVNSLGYHEMCINGSRVGEEVLQPAVSQLDKHSLIVTYDITPHIRDGENTIEIHLAQGWYKKHKYNAQYPGPVVKAEVCQLDGGRWQTLLVTGSGWEASATGRRYNGSWHPLNFGGEVVDARVRPEWSAAAVAGIRNMEATPQLFAGNSVIETVDNPLLMDSREDTLWFDFGRELTGMLQVDFTSLSYGQDIKIDYSDYIPAGESFEVQDRGDPGDEYIASGEPFESFSNRFHTHSFRYVRISGARPSQTKAVRALRVSGLDPRKASSFECSDERLNDVHDLIHYTMQCLVFSGYMVDCPHLERMGYGGDGNSSTMTLQTMYDARSTYANWMTAWGDAIGEDGSLPHVAPVSGADGGGPYWCGFIVKAPWRSYLNYGDFRFVERLYDKMVLWMAYVERNMQDGLLRPWPSVYNRIWYLGDWLAPAGVDVGGESVDHANNCFISDCLGNMRDMARLLGKSADAERFESMRKALNSRIHEEFYHPETCTYANGIPLDMAYAMLAGVVPPEIYDKVSDKLTTDSYGRYNAHIAAGLFGVPVFTEWTIRDRKAGLMAAILRQPDYPGYLYMIANGATATWESWDAERSRIHNCYNGIGTWFYQALAGIRPDNYRHFFIDPQEVDGVDRVKASKPTPYGDIAIDLTRKRLRVTIPVGTSATVFPGSPLERTLPAGTWSVRR